MESELVTMAAVMVTEYALVVTVVYGQQTCGDLAAHWCLKCAVFLGLHPLLRWQLVRQHLRLPHAVYALSHATSMGADITAARHQ